MAAFGTKFVHNSRLAGYLFVLTFGGQMENFF